MSFHHGRVPSLATSTGRRALATCGADGSVRIWAYPEARAGRELFTDEAMQYARTALCSPNALA